MSHAITRGPGIVIGGNTLKFYHILPLLFLLFAGPASAQVTRFPFPYVPIVQSTTGYGSCTFDRSIKTGNIIWVGAQYFGSSSTPSVTDTRSTPLAQKLLDFGNPATELAVAQYAGIATATGSDTITFTVAGNSFQVINCAEFPPIFSLTVDGTPDVSRAGSNTNISSGTLNTTLNSDFIIAMVGGDHNNSTLIPVLADGYTEIGMLNASDAGMSEFKVAGAAGAYTATATGGGVTAHVIGTVAFRSNAISINSPAVLPDGGLSKAYDYTLLATGGAGAYTWSITSGALQSGLSLNASTGRISGTPTSSSNSNITFQVTDGTHTTTKAVTLKIAVSLNTIAVVQTKVSTVPNADTGAIVFNSNVTAGDLLGAVGGNGFIGVVGDDGRKQSCSDLLGTIFFPVTETDITSPATSPLVGGVQIFLGVATSSGPDTITCVSIRGIFELSNAQYTPDNISTTIANSASPITNALTTLVPNEAIIVLGQGFTSTSVLTLSAPFTGLNSGDNNVFGYQLVTTVTAYTASFTMTGNTSGWWGISSVGIRPSAGAVGQKTRHQTEWVSAPEYHQVESDPILFARGDTRHKGQP